MKGHVEKAILREVIDENAQASDLRDTVRDQPEDATRDARMALGEIVSNAIVAQRDEGTAKVVEALTSLAGLVNVREPTHEEDAARVAVLVEVARQEELENVVGALAEEPTGRTVSQMADAPNDPVPSGLWWIELRPFRVVG